MVDSQVPRRPALGPLVLRTALALLLLAVLRTVLTLPGGRDPETFLGLGRFDRPELEAVRAAWNQLVLLAVGPLQASMADAARLYWLLDTALFMPLYAWLLLELVRRMLAGATHPRTLRVAMVLPWLVLALLAVDLVENSGGLARLAATGADGASSPGGLLVAALLAALAAGGGLWWWRRQLAGERLFEAMVETGRAATARARDAGMPVPGDDPLAAWHRHARWVMLAAGLVALVLVAMHAFAPALALQAGAWVHRAKFALVLAIAAALAGPALPWLWREGTHYPRAELRRGLGDIAWRTRYVLATLAMLVALTLVLDQCRDVAIGVADGLFEWPQALWAWPTMALSVLAVWALSFSCWLWTRLACRMPSPGAPPLLHARVEPLLGQAAQGTARVLGIAPAFVVAMMSALAARDAAWAGTSDAAGWLVAPVALLLMGLACVAGGWMFLWGREQMAVRSANGAAAAPPGPAVAMKDYYNDPALGPPHDWMRCVADEKYRFVAGRGPGPATLPILALALAVGLRCLSVAFDPGVPVAFVVIVFSLVGWLGFFGWLSMKEQREARPWLFALVALAGALGFAGLTDNHAVRVGSGAEIAALPALPWQLAGTTLLALLLLGAAWAIAHNGAPGRWWKVLLGITGLSVALLAMFDRASAPAAMDPPAPSALSSPSAPSALAAAAPAAVPQTLEQHFERWAAASWRGGAGDASSRPLLVASEGGGVRAAYWTARVLAELDADPRFRPRLLLLSGVSGGAVGEAVFAACPRGDVSGCVQRFGEADLLTPLLGAWMFEDLLARVLPTSLPHNPWFTGYCRQPGCGFLTRGVWFEQALERAVPGLAQGIVAASPGGPALLLNATWVESGDRAIASGLEIDWQADRFANARDQLAFVGNGSRAGVDMPLSAAAHNAARFPFVNAIGRLRDGSGQTGHLADGGYFDNAGAHGVVDVLARLRRWIDERPACAEDDDACRHYQAWLKQLRPQVVVVQNGVARDCEASGPEGANVAGARGTPQDHLECLTNVWQRRPDATMDTYEPSAPARAGRWGLFVDALGPLITLANVAGTGSGGRRAEALLKRECLRFAPGNEDCVVRIAQRSDGGVLYPLGWYLSPTARRALDKQAVERVREASKALHR